MSPESPLTAGPQHQAERPVFDYPGTLARLGGSKSLFAELSRYYIEDSVTVLAQLREALLSRDPHDVELAVHRLKGLIANFGADRATLTVSEAEYSARAGQIEEVALAYSRLEACVLELRGTLSLLLRRAEEESRR